LCRNLRRHVWYCKTNHPETMKIEVDVRAKLVWACIQAHLVLQRKEMG
jgi:hypothetical protein